MRAAETKAGLGEALTAAAARSYHRLLAVKDEWEVARLFAAPEFAKTLAAEFEGPFKLHFHIGAWPFARPDPRTGVMGKGEAGPWAMTAFRLMARLRFLRGTLLDPFRHSDERKLERRLSPSSRPTSTTSSSGSRLRIMRSPSASRACPRRSRATAG